MIRLIVQSTENGESEYVRFTDDLEAPASDFIIPEHSIDTDIQICCSELEACSFPMNYDLKRS